MNYKIKSKIWIETEGDILLGKGRVNLLNAIENTGSLSKAAKQLGMSYKKAWSLTQAMNERAKKPVIIMSVGGKGGGGAKLTSYGKSLINTFVTINENCNIFLETQLTKTSL
ncbi:LysR family transcriptional regulator [Yeosuana sp. MJ-SS3]|uniref:LysR family transcriptional regulator n=1 Tax=Gilvirhabdus luticola TaxID=3079858 RepID=A0ABU3U427_9FLAO|nr:LysR family transcriptional regulator [Yeosuana sp. MJ-SS3]MDU8885074.1 LysR family transcriptional regulator [Yeosuana sp. MJ-SS3]